MKSFRQCSLRCQRWECEWKGWWAGQPEQPESHTVTASSSKGNNLSTSCSRWGWHFWATLPMPICLHLPFLWHPNGIQRALSCPALSDCLPVPNTGKGWPGLSHIPVPATRWQLLPRHCSLVSEHREDIPALLNPVLPLQWWEGRETAASVREGWEGQQGRNNSVVLSDSCTHCTTPQGIRVSIPRLNLQRGRNTIAPHIPELPGVFTECIMFCDFKHTPGMQFWAEKSHCWHKRKKIRTLHLYTFKLCFNSPFPCLFGKAVYHKCMRSHSIYFYSVCTRALNSDVRMNTIAWFIPAELAHRK